MEEQQKCRSQNPCSVPSPSSGSCVEWPQPSPFRAACDLRKIKTSIEHRPRRLRHAATESTIPLETFLTPSPDILTRVHCDAPVWVYASPCEVDIGMEKSTTLGRTATALRGHHLLGANVNVGSLCERALSFPSCEAVESQTVARVGQPKGRAQHRGRCPEPSSTGDQKHD